MSTVDGVGPSNDESSTLIVSDVQFGYRGGFRLGPVAFRLPKGVTCLVGANGAGKSTLFRILADMQKPSAGIVERPGRNIGYLPQSPTFPSNATCEELLTYVAWLQNVPRKQRTEAVKQALASVDLGDRATARIKSLSGGMARRLGIAHALVHGPDLLLLDEPTAGLDPVQRLKVRDVLAAIGRDRTVIVSTHLVEDVRGLADRVVVMSEGQLVFDGTVKDLETLANPEAPGQTDLERAMATLMVGEQ